MPKRYQLMIVAGEPSGDAHAAALVNALRRAPDGCELDFFGATGPLMRAAGVETVINSDELAIMGILEVTRVLPKFLHAFRELKRAALERSAALLRTREAEARTARAAADRAVADLSAHVARIDSRRDLTAQYVGELQVAYDRLQQQISATVAGRQIGRAHV